jgi:hypothetical protein
MQNDRLLSRAPDNDLLVAEHGELMMRCLLFLLAYTLTLTLSFDAVAQTSSPPGLSGRALRKQDRQICTTQATQQNVLRRNRAEFVRKCMATRQGERKAAARALRKQDRQICTTQAAQQNVLRRNFAEFLRKCMAARQGERRAAGR